MTPAKYQQRLDDAHAANTRDYKRFMQQKKYGARRRAIMDTHNQLKADVAEWKRQKQAHESCARRSATA